jgi:hypothetical protein
VCARLHCDLQAHQEYERRLKEELEVKAAKEQEIADLVRAVLYSLAVLIFDNSDPSSLCCAVTVDSSCLRRRGSRLSMLRVTVKERAAAADQFECFVQHMAATIV